MSSFAQFQTIPPYEPLLFPLPNDTLEQMIQYMPNSFKDVINECIDQVAGSIKIPKPQIDAEQIKFPVPTTPLAPNCKTQLKTEQYSQLSMLVEDSDETESVQEDPNDPEWFEPPQRIPRTQ